MRVVVTTLALCAGVVLPWSDASAAPASSLVLRYAFNTDSSSSITDSSANALTGTLVNADPANAFVPGPPGKGSALRLRAPDREYVAVPEGDALDVNRYTLTAWIRYTGLVTAETRGRWEVLEKAGAYWLNVRTDGHVRAGGFYGGCDDSQYWHFFDSRRTIEPDVWTHVAATYNGSRLRIFIDGVRSGSMPVAGTTCSNDEPLAVGAKNAPAKGVLEAFWDGRMDEVRVYGKALRAARIAKIAG